MNKVRRITWHLVKNLSEKGYFWPLISLIFLGLILDVHSTYLFVVKSGIEGEVNPVLVFFFHRFALLELGIGATVLLALVLNKMLILVVVPATFLVIVWVVGVIVVFSMFSFL